MSLDLAYSNHRVILGTCNISQIGEIFSEALRSATPARARYNAADVVERRAKLETVPSPSPAPVGKYIPPHLR
jgi:hypothetical protein